MHNRDPVWLISFFVAALAGCGGSGPVRHPLGGTVRVDGVAIENGSISFLPTKGTSGPPATTLIIRGEYQFTTATGPVSGMHRVVVGADPKQKFPVTNQMPAPARNQPPAPVVQARGIESAKRAPITSGTERRSESPPYRTAKQRKSEAAKPTPPDPGRNQWELQYVVPAELTQTKDFDFVTPNEAAPT